MIKKFSKESLRKHSACGEGVRWFLSQKETEPVAVVEKLIEEKHFDWANWAVVRCMTYKQYVSYAVFAAEQVIDIYEKKNPDDKRPRQAIDAAKKCIENPSKKNKDAAYAAAYAATNAAHAAYAATNATNATNAAYAATNATNAAYAATNATNAAYAANAANAAGDKMHIKLIRYGLKLLKTDSKDGDNDL